MTTLDPTTGQPLPADAIQRILYITPKVHIYAIPPLTSNKGYTASQWTTQPAIFTARLRILETAVPLASATSLPPTTNIQQQEKVSTTILLEDPASGALFAAAPYTHPSVIAHCIDSSRFFAVRVVGDGGRKATLGMGFEERSDAFDFGVALQDAGRIMGFEAVGGKGQSGAGRVGAEGLSGKVGVEVKKDYSLKEGETISVSIGGKGGRTMKSSKAMDGAGDGGGGLFKIGPPPSSASVSGGGAGTGNVPMLAPPPSAADVRREMRTTEEEQQRGERDKKDEMTAEELGFDDGEFGEFQ